MSGVEGVNPGQFGVRTLYDFTPQKGLQICVHNTAVFFQNKRK